MVGANAKAAVEAMNEGDVVLLENTRYRAEETKNEDTFSAELASLCDVFVMMPLELLTEHTAPMSA